MLKLYVANIELLDEQNSFDAAFEKMNAQRREKILRCKNEADKKRSLLAGSLLRLALEKEGYAYDALSFSLTEKGKPVIKELSNMFFSLSHSGEYAVCVVSDTEIGVDIESKQKTLFQNGKENSMQSIAKRVLSDREREKFSACTKENVPEVFLTYWTRKESYSKAIGTGIGIELNEVETDTDEFFTTWLNDSYCISIYRKDAGFDKLQIHELNAL